MSQVLFPPLRLQNQANGQNWLLVLVSGFVPNTALKIIHYNRRLFAVFFKIIFYKLLITFVTCTRTASLNNSVNIEYTDLYTKVK